MPMIRCLEVFGLNLLEILKSYRLHARCRNIPTTSGSPARDEGHWAPNGTSDMLKSSMLAVMEDEEGRKERGERGGEGDIYT